jgi:cysteine dioxygenase
MKILDGELQETLFDWPTSSTPDDETPFDITANDDNNTDVSVSQSPLNVSRDTIYQPNQVTYVHGKIYKFFFFFIFLMLTL